jgi:hypothetical protein
LLVGGIVRLLFRQILPGVFCATQVKGDKFHEYLLKEGYVDERQPLSNEQILAQTLEASIESIKKGSITAPEVNQLGMMLLKCFGSSV